MPLIAYLGQLLGFFMLVMNRYILCQVVRDPFTPNECLLGSLSQQRSLWKSSSSYNLDTSFNRSHIHHFLIEHKVSNRALSSVKAKTNDIYFLS